MTPQGRLLAVLIAGASCAPVRPSAKPLGGTESAESEPHRDRRAASESEASADTDAGLANAENVEVAAPAKPAESAAKTEAVAPAAVATPGVELSFPPLKAGDTLKTTLELNATLNVDLGGGGPAGGANQGEIESTGKAKIRVLKAAPNRLEELSVEFTEGKMRSKLQGADEQETLSGDKYVVSFAGATPTAKDSSGKAADTTALFGMVFMLEPLVELQARLGQGPQRRSVGWAELVALPHFRGLIPPPPDVSVGPLDLKLSAVGGEAPAETATFTLRLPITMTHELGSGRVDLAGTCVLPARGLRPIDLALAGPMTGSMQTPLANAGVTGHMRYRARYEFAP